MISRLVSRRGLLYSAAAWIPLRALAQQKDDPSFAAGVNVVNVFASVHNTKGEIVKDLKQTDFSLEEDGRPQTIKYFARETDLPLTLGLMIDTSGSQRRLLDQEKKAMSQFISQVLREDRDQAFVIKFDAEAELMQDLTPSKKKLQAAVNDIEAAAPRQLQRRDPNSGGPPPGGGPRNGGGTVLYDSVLLASTEEMKKQKGRKALILLTDGVDRGSRSSLTECIEAAQRSDAFVYSILFADSEQHGFGGGSGGGPRVGFPGGGRSGGGMGGGRRGGGNRMPQQQPRENGKKILERISKETGGAFFEVSKKLALSDIFDKIEQELRSQYNLGYTPEKSDNAGFRKIKVTAKGKGLIVQARDGYYAS
jgi:VWFA-related protein